MNITKEHLQHIEKLGYKITVVHEENLRGTPRTFLVGKCPSNHNIKSEIRKSMQVPSCKECYYKSLSNKEENLQMLKDLDYTLTSYTKKLPSGKNKIFVKGTCKENHEIECTLKVLTLNPICRKCNKDSRVTLTQHLTLLQKLGYKVDIIKIINKNGWEISTIVGTCPKGHEVKNITRHVPNPRCNDCYNGKVREQNLSKARIEGYRVKIILKRQANQSPRTYFTGKCPNGHSFEMKVVDFISGGLRCSPCKKDEIVARVERAISETDYDLKVERVAVKGKDRDTRLYVVGTCDKGHKISMSAQGFEKGSRCKGCVKYGFSTGRSAVFYLISGSKITVKKNAKAKSGIANEPILKYGIFHPGSGRLMIHGSRGFDTSPLFSLYHKDSKIIAELESKVREFIESNGIKTCREIGLSFDGATESFLQGNLEIESLVSSIKEIALELELQHGSKFQRISTEEAVIIGDRSKSVATKRSIESTIYKLDNMKTDIVKTKKRAKGYAHA